MDTSHILSKMRSFKGSDELEEVALARAECLLSPLHRSDIASRARYRYLLCSLHFMPALTFSRVRERRVRCLTGDATQPLAKGDAY